jgi:hypothetical protein
LEEPDSPWLHYLLLRAVNKFHTENGSHPGYYDDNVETDIAKLKVKKHMTDSMTIDNIDPNLKICRDDRVASLVFLTILVAKAVVFQRMTIFTRCVATVQPSCTPLQHLLVSNPPFQFLPMRTIALFDAPGLPCFCDD